MKIFVETIRIYDQDTGIEFEIEKIINAYKEKRENSNKSNNRTFKLGKNQNSWRKPKLNVPGNIKSGRHQA